MSQLSIEHAIDEAESRNHPCEHEFWDGVCHKCFCPEKPKYQYKAWYLMEANREDIKEAQLVNR